MTVTIKRESVLFRGFARLYIYIDDEKVDSITSGEEKEVELPGEDAFIRVSHFGGKSNELKVSKGDSISLSVASWASWFFTLFIILLPFLSRYLDSTGPLVIILLPFIVYYGVFTIFKPFRLVKKPKNAYL